MQDPTHIPRVGDVAVCVGCAAILEFNDEMSLVVASHHKAAVVRESPIYQQALTAVAQYRSARGKAAS